jgi:hypothetical protein
MSPLLFVLVLGCSKGGGANSSVHGKVTYKGAPVTAGSVRFHPADGSGGEYKGFINKSGEYSVVGLPSGEMIVTVETESANTKLPAGARSGQDYEKKGAIPQQAPDMLEKMRAREMGPKQSAQESQGEYVKIPTRYSDAKMTPLRATIGRGDNSFPIELTE